MNDDWLRAELDDLAADVPELTPEDEAWLGEVIPQVQDALEDDLPEVDAKALAARVRARAAAAPSASASRPWVPLAAAAAALAAVGVGAALVLQPDPEPTPAIAATAPPRPTPVEPTSAPTPASPAPTRSPEPRPTPATSPSPNPTPAPAPETPQPTTSPTPTATPTDAPTHTPAPTPTPTATPSPTPSPRSKGAAPLQIVRREGKAKVRRDGELVAGGTTLLALARGDRPAGRVWCKRGTRLRVTGEAVVVTRGEVVIESPGQLAIQLGPHPLGLDDGQVQATVRGKRAEVDVFSGQARVRGQLLRPGQGVDVRRNRLKRLAARPLERWARESLPPRGTVLFDEPCRKLAPKRYRPFLGTPQREFVEAATKPIAPAEVALGFGGLKLFGWDPAASMWLRYRVAKAGPLTLQLTFAGGATSLVTIQARDGGWREALIPLHSLRDPRGLAAPPKGTTVTLVALQAGKRGERAPLSLAGLRVVVIPAK